MTPHCTPGKSAQSCRDAAGALLSLAASTTSVLSIPEDTLAPTTDHPYQFTVTLSKVLNPKTQNPTPKPPKPYALNPTVSMVQGPASSNCHLLHLLLLLYSFYMSWKLLNLKFPGRSSFIINFLFITRICTAETWNGVTRSSFQIT